MGGLVLEAVILCGGQSSRMGRPKHDLKFSDGRTIVSHLVDRLRSARSLEPRVHISLCDREQSFQTASDDELQFIYDKVNFGHAPAELGPAAGLLAAHHRCPTAHWLVIACDYPLISVDDLRQLLNNYEGSITCFENVGGWPEPLLAIWSPVALQALEKNVQVGISGPIKTLMALPTKRLKPLDEQSLLNANTPNEWEKAVRLNNEIRGG